MPPPTRDHIVLEQDNFRGLYSRGVSDSTPEGYFIDTLNTKFNEGEVSTRDGSVLNVSKTNIRRFFIYKRLNETPRFIILDTSGNLYDSLIPGVPIWTDAGILDFSMVNSNNRAYITPHNRVKGIASRNLLVYEGSGTARQASGDAPTGFTLVTSNSATVGNCEAGFHFFAMAFITSSGFITAPGPADYSLLNCVGGKSVTISNIAIGGASVVGRVLLATKSIPTDLFTGNQDAYELFFIPSGIILENTSTTTTVSFYDADLLDSADYLLDGLSPIPAGLGVITYNNRLVTWGESGNPFTIRISEAGQPEVFNSIAGFIQLDPADAVSGVKNCYEYRKALIIETANRTYSTTDNGSDPNTWSVVDVDKSAGTECFGVATVLDARGTNTDRAFLATRSGLISYEGYAKRPELSFNIEGIWNRINKKVFNLVQIIDDPISHRMFITIPLDNSTVISHILYADYSKSFTVYGTLDERAIKWSVWSFPSAPVSIMGDLDATTNRPVLHYALTNNIYTVKEGLRDDFGNVITSHFMTNLKAALSNWVNHFGRVVLRVNGSGVLHITLTGEDFSNFTTAPSIVMLPTPGREFDTLFNFKNEKMAVKCQVSSAGDYFIVSKLTTWAKALWSARAE